jgi:penicillin-binding protein 1C
LALLVLPLAVLGGAWLGLRLVPLPKALFEPPRTALELADRNGQTLRQVPDEGWRYGRRVRFGEVPGALVQATLAAEDKRFWQHHGVDWLATGRAAVGLVRHRRVVSGGSTITQQLIKLAQPRPRTVRTKLIEAAQALRLEQVWDKRAILAEYLNRLDYGSLCQGCAEAAQHYFGKPLAELSVAEAAFLAGLPQSPGRLNPYRNLERARKRQQWILQRQRDLRWLTEPEYQRAAAAPLRLRSPRRPFQAPHFVDLVLSQEGERLTSAGSRTVRTTLDLNLNCFVEQRLRAQLGRLRAQHVRNGAVVVLENRTGDVLALVGSEDFFEGQSGQVNGAWAPRSGGSTFKPFTYLLALEAGATPATTVADVPTEFATPTGVFRPVNYNHRCYGPLRYRQALANSLNIPAVKTLASLGGPAPLRNRLRACGLSTLNKPAEFYGLGLTIGNAEARLLELVNAFAVLARLGEYKPYRLLLQMDVPAGQRVADAGAAWLIADILADNSARALAFGPSSSLSFDFPVACKTGTSSDFRDNWALGYTPEFAVGVWVGNFDGSPMEGVSGVTGAAPILHEVFAHLHKRFGTSWYVTPDQIVSRRVHPITGRLVETTPADAVLEKFLAKNQPAAATAQDYDAEGRVVLSAEYAEWAKSGDNWLAGQVTVAEALPTTVVRVVSPLPGATYFLDPDLPDGGRWLPLKAEGPPGLVWESDSLSFRQEGARTSACLVEGRHRLTVRHPVTRGQAETWIVVRSL